MADPLSAVASVVGIADFGVKSINSLRHLYRSYKDAPKQLEKLRNEAPTQWAYMMRLGQLLDAAAEIGDDNFSRVIFELGEQGNTHLIEFDKLLANDDHLDSETRQRQTRRSLIGKKLRHIAKRWQLRSKHTLALAHKKDFENVRERMDSVLLAENTRMQILNRQDVNLQRLASLHEKIVRTEESRSSKDPVDEASSSRAYSIHRCPPDCLCNCHNHMKRFPAHVLRNSMLGIWRAMAMASFRNLRPNSYCHECASVPRAKVAGMVNWRVPKWFGSLILQFSVSYSLRRGLSCRLKASQRVQLQIGDIFWCIECGDIRQLHSLLKTCPAAVNNQDDIDGQSPLQSAIDWGRPDMITLLLENGADAAIEDDDGVNAAVLFALGASAGVFPRTEHYELYGKLSTIDTLEDVPEFLGYGNVHKIILGLLEMDLREYLETLEEDERIEQIRHSDGYGGTPLHLAAMHDNAEAAEILLSFGAEPDVQDKSGNTPLALLARYWRSTKSFKLLVQRGANIHAKNRLGLPIIHLAAIHGSLEFMEQMYSFGVDIEERDSIGDTPLVAAARNNKFGITERLLEWGADIEASDRIGRTALLMAVSQNAHQSICLLLRKSANPRHVDVNGYTIWHHAAVAADARTMEILQSLEPTLEELDRRNKRNETPFDTLRRSFRNRQEVWDMFADLWKKAIGLEKSRKRLGIQDEWLQFP